MAMYRCKVAIIGCGLAGAATALAIQRAGHDVTIFEQAEGLNEIGAGIQLPYNCTRVLSRWGLLPAIESRATQPSHVLLRSYKDGSVLFKYVINSLHEDGAAIPHLLLPRSDFLKTLFDEALRLGASVRFGSKVASIDFDRPAIRFVDKQIYEFDVVLAADGINSACRRLLLGEDISPKLSGDAAWRLAVPITEIESDRDLSVLLQGLDISCWMGPYGHAVCYQLAQSSLLNVVLVGADNAGPSSDVRPSPRQEAEIFFANWDPRLRKLSQLANVLKTPLRDSHKLASWCHSEGKFALVGDACHAALPYLAQGAAQGIEDAAVLGRLFSKLESKGQIKDVLKTYEAIRKPRVSVIIAESEARGDIFQMPDGKAQQERDLELRKAGEGEGFPRGLEDPETRSRLAEYDADREVDQVWDSNHA